MYMLYMNSLLFFLSTFIFTYTVVQYDSENFSENTGKEENGWR